MQTVTKGIPCSRSPEVERFAPAESPLEIDPIRIKPTGLSLLSRFNI